MARTLRAQLEAQVQAMLEKKALEALAIYNADPLEKEKPDYPFATHPGQRSVKAKASQSIRRVPGGILITIAAEGAKYLEFGNDAKGSEIKAKPGSNLYIPLKRGGRSRLKGKQRIEEVGGKLFLVKQSVASYAGRHPLQRAIDLVFGPGHIVK